MPARRPRLRAGARPSIGSVFRRLYAHYGPQGWWPAQTPFEVMVGAVLTQNAAWSNVERAMGQLTAAGALSPKAIVDTHPRRLARWIRPSGYFNVKAARLRALCRWVIQAGGVEALRRWPTARLRAALLAVHGVGPETADDILLYAFERPVFVIDAYTRRIFGRLGLIDGTESYETLRAWFERAIGRDVKRLNEFHALLVIHGKTRCRNRPLCGECPLATVCAYGRGAEASG